MGGLLSRGGDKGGADLSDAFIDFESAQPGSEAEKLVYDKALICLQKAPLLLDELLGYTGADEFIRQAIQTPSEETLKTAWTQCLPMVDKLKSFYEFGDELVSEMPALMKGMCDGGNGDVVESIMENKSLVKLFADMVSFAFEFDAVKMRNPSIQNDFSYYKRQLQRMQMDGQDTEHLAVHNELAALISLFYAVPNPMISSLCKGVSTLSMDTSKVSKALETMAGVCLAMVKNPDLDSQLKDAETTRLYILRVMTGIIVLYDNVNSNGVFHKKCSIDVKTSVQIIQKHHAAAAESTRAHRETESMLQAIRWSTPHFSLDSTPKEIAKLF